MRYEVGRARDQAGVGGWWGEGIADQMGLLRASRELGFHRAAGGSLRRVLPGREVKEVGKSSGESDYRHEVAAYCLGQLSLEPTSFPGRALAACASC